MIGRVSQLRLQAFWLTACLASAVSAQTPAEQARDRLTRVGVPIAASSLVQYAAQGDVNTVGLLLSAGVPAAAREPVRSATALHAAAALGHVQVLEQLLGSRAEVDAQDWRGLTPLINAVHGGHGKAIERLLKAGARVDVRPAQAPTALVTAVHAGRIAVVRQLLEAGASPTQADAFGATPLEVARSTRREAIIQLLAERS
jgi:ankyrin repeat protein